MEQYESLGREEECKMEVFKDQPWKEENSPSP